MKNKQLSIGRSQLTIGKVQKPNKKDMSNLIKKREKSRGEGQKPIDKGQPQSHAPVICTLELGIEPWKFPNWD